MSLQKGNVHRSRSQKHHNVTAFKNDKYDTSQRTKKINSKLHDGVCQRCKDVLEWRVKYRKYKPLSQPKKCVKCLQKTVKDSYHIICKPCAIQLELCAKCGKNEDIVLPIVKNPQPMEGEASASNEGKSEDEEEELEDSDLNSDDDFPEEKKTDQCKSKSTTQPAS